MIRRRIRVRRKWFPLFDQWMWEVSFVGVRWGAFDSWPEAMEFAYEKTHMLSRNGSWKIPRPGSRTTS